MNDFVVTELGDPSDLLESLSKDTDKVGRKILRMLLSTYFPNPEDGPPIIAHLLRICPEAGQAFCKHLAGLASSGVCF